jgi:hypothetical protein
MERNGLGEHYGDAGEEKCGRISEKMIIFACFANE